MTDQGYRRPVRLWGFVIRVPLLAVLVAASAGAADPPKGGVRVPAGPVVPTPMPNPAAPIKLTPDLVFAVDADYECVVLSSPADRLRITADKGPLKVRGKFVDGNGSVETRTFSGSHVYFVEAASAGECELLILPVGGKEGDLIRRRILCVVGPQPPPDPPTPDPKPPTPEPKPKVETLRVIFVVESGSLPPGGQLAATDGAAVRGWLKVNATGYRKYDPQQVTDHEAAEWKALWGAVKDKVTAPCVVVEVNGKPFIEPLPATEAASLELLKKYKGN